MVAYNQLLALHDDTSTPGASLRAPLGSVLLNKLSVMRLRSSSNLSARVIPPGGGVPSAGAEGEVTEVPGGPGGLLPSILGLLPPADPLGRLRGGG